MIEIFSLQRNTNPSVKRTNVESVWMISDHTSRNPPTHLRRRASGYFMTKSSRSSTCMYQSVALVLQLHLCTWHAARKSLGTCHWWNQESADGVKQDWRRNIGTRSAGPIVS